MSLLDTITKGRRPRYIWALIYGVDGVGKSTMFSHAPNPIFVGAEKGTEQLDVARFPQTESIGELFAQLRTLQVEKHDFQTVVLDSLPQPERFNWRRCLLVILGALLATLLLGRVLERLRVADQRPTAPAMSMPVVPATKK
jgi:AAA domain-containing protein